MEDGVFGPRGRVGNQRRRKIHEVGCLYGIGRGRWDWVKQKRCLEKKKSPPKGGTSRGICRTILVEHTVVNMQSNSIVSL